MSRDSHTQEYTPTDEQPHLYMDKNIGEQTQSRSQTQTHAQRANMKPWLTESHCISIMYENNGQFIHLWTAS